jgi:hypothetical protein
MELEVKSCQNHMYGNATIRPLGWLFGDDFHEPERTFSAVAATVNIVISVWAIHQTLKNWHGLNAFASKLRWTVVFLGAAEFFSGISFSRNWAS